MEARVTAIREGRASEMVWLLEHPSIYTAGTSAKQEELLEVDRFPVYETGRGGGTPTMAPDSGSDMCCSI